MFVNRVKELQLLNDEYKEEGFRFSVLYGRRRVGKTTLLKEYIQNKESIYFLVTLESENIVLKRFQDIIANYLNDDFLKELKMLMRVESFGVQKSTIKTIWIKTRVGIVILI